MSTIFEYIKCFESTLHFTFILICIIDLHIVYYEYTNIHIHICILHILERFYIVQLSTLQILITINVYPCTYEIYFNATYIFPTLFAYVSNHLQTFFLKVYTSHLQILHYIMRI